MKKVRILHLYPDHMSIYGDYGNVLCLQRRLEWRNIAVELVQCEVGESLPDNFDLLFVGGGQDTGQLQVASDLNKKANHIEQFVSQSGPILAICGGYQLLGRYFDTKDNGRIEGIGVLDVVTTATDERMIGNVVVETEDFGSIVGFENHSGATDVIYPTKTLGKIKKGYGNNPTKKFEGARKANIIGTYLHGSLLPKNPRLADWLLQKALDHAQIELALNPIDDWLESEAHDFALRLKP